MTDNSLEAIVPPGFCEVAMPDGTSWVRDTVRCGCGDDPGWRHASPWDDDKEDQCDACGNTVRDVAGNAVPDTFVVPN